MIYLIFLLFFFFHSSAHAATSVPFTIAMSEAVNVAGTPRIAVDVGGVTRYADYSAGTGTNALTFTYAMQAGDVDLDGVALSSPIDLNGGTITDTSGNPATLTFTPPDTSNIKINYPSLGMDFVADADGRYTLNGTVYDDLPAFLSATGGTFTRNSIGTYYDSTGTLQTATANTPRFDHDPVTHQPKGILIEESRTNRIPNSYFENWTTAYPTSWNNPGNNITKVAGVFGTNAMRITGPLSNNGNRISTSGLNLTASTAYTLTVRVKLISGTGTLALALDSWSSTAFSFSTASMVAGQYVTLSQTQTIPATGTTSGGFHTNGTAIVVDLDYVQLEQGAFPTSYIPTTTAAVTRAADALSIPTGPWVNTSTASLFAIADTIPFNASLSGAIPVSYISDGTPNNEWGIRFDTGGTITGYPFIVGGINQTTIFAYPVLSGVNRLAYAMSLNTRSSYSNGGSLSTGSYSSSPPSTVMGVGKNISSQYLNGWIEKLKYYPKRIPDTQLQLMTQ